MTVQRRGLLLHRGLCVCLLVTTMSPTKIFEPTEMLLECGLGLAQGKVLCGPGSHGKQQFRGDISWPSVQGQAVGVLPRSNSLLGLSLGYLAAN